MFLFQSFVSCSFFILLTNSFQTLFDNLCLLTSNISKNLRFSFSLGVLILSSLGISIPSIVFSFSFIHYMHWEYSLHISWLKILFVLGFPFICFCSCFFWGFVFFWLIYWHHPYTWDGLSLLSILRICIVLCIFSGYNLGRIIAITNTKGNNESLWKIYLYIFAPVSSTFSLLIVLVITFTTCSKILKVS